MPVRRLGAPLLALAVAVDAAARAAPPPPLSVTASVGAGDDDRVCPGGSKARLGYPELEYRR